MSFPNSQTGWCVGDYGLAIHTNDGGQSWKQVKVPTEVALNSIHFVDSNVGYITGRKEVYDAKTRTSTFGVIILKTDDAGKNWNTSYEDNETASVWQIATLSKKVAVAIMDGNYLLRTEDAGASWQIVSPKIKAGFTRVAFNSKGQGWAVGENGSFYHSLDRAKTWQKVNDLPPDLLHCDWSGINFADGRFGIVVGNNGVIATTKDGGTTWIKTKPSIQENLRSVYLQNHKGLITGEQTVYRLTALE